MYLFCLSFFASGLHIISLKYVFNCTVFNQFFFLYISQSAMGLSLFPKQSGCVFDVRHILRQQPRVWPNAPFAHCNLVHIMQSMYQSCAPSSYKLWL